MAEDTGTKETEMFQDTLNILKNRYYFTPMGKEVVLKLEKEEREEAEVFLPDDIKALSQWEFDFEPSGEKCRFIVTEHDSFVQAQQLLKQEKYNMFDDEKGVLVLSMANPFNPGGGVKLGTTAQQEELCRRSSLMDSIDNKKAEKYYNYNRGNGDSDLDTNKMNLGSDALIISPHVEVFKDEDGKLMPETFTVSVMTCGAPMITEGLGDLSQEEYETMLYRRICGMLRVAAQCGYRYLVLGAFGCGAFGNDAHLVSDLFYKAFNELNLNGCTPADFFRRVDFAVRCNDDAKYNFREFERRFSDFHRENQ